MRGARVQASGGLPATFWRAAAVVIVGRSGVYLQLFLGYYLARSLHLSSSQVAVVLAFWGAGWAAGTPLGGWLADRAGARAVVTTGNIAAAAAYLAAGSARSFPLLLAAAGAVGVAQDLWRPGVMAVIAGTASDELQRKHRLALTGWFVQITGVFAAISGGFIGARWGLGWLFPGNAAAALAAALAAQWLPGRQPRQAAATSRPGGADPLLVAFTSLTVAALAVEAESMIALPVRFANAGIAPLAAGVIIAVNPATYAVVQPLVQKWLISLPAVAVCALGMALTGIGIAVTGSGHGLAWFASTSVIWVLGEIALLSCGPAVVSSIAPDGSRARYLGIWQASMGLAVLTAAAGGAALIRAGGLHLLWVSCAVTGLAAAAGCMALARPVAIRSGSLTGRPLRTAAVPWAAPRAAAVCLLALTVAAGASWRIDLILSARR